MLAQSKTASSHGSRWAPNQPVNRGLVRPGADFPVWVGQCDYDGNECSTLLLISALGLAGLLTIPKLLEPVLVRIGISGLALGHVRCLSMSLKFGIYLVEQRIISPEQFCGLIKIQEESMMTLATIALRKNLMTIKQVDTVLSMAELERGSSFVRLAQEKGMVDQQDANTLLKSQEETTPTIRTLLVECGLLTKHQCTVLFAHYQKHGSVGWAKSAATQTVNKPHMKTAPSNMKTPAMATAGTSNAPAAPQTLPQPKFQQRKPVIVRQEANQ